jgi:hypothetical protein
MELRFHHILTVETEVREDLLLDTHLSHSRNILHD